MRRSYFLYPALALFALPWEASAHDFFKGGGDFYDGLVHPLVSVPHILILLALGMFIGRQLEKVGPSIFGIYLASLAIGLGCATFSIGFSSEPVLHGVAALLGLLLALGRPLPRSLNWALILIAGILMGLDFAPETATSKAGLNTGTGVTLYIAFFMAVGLGDTFQKQEWQRIGQRVIGSWIAACALLALSLKVFSP